mmetsp:Transcript_18765/g.33176  ORF Transcript_18765/g.33176 Transcript_18765/m.33176 type:complete len:710 (+) Transcript_18765:539-2668(+)
MHRPMATGVAGHEARIPVEEPVSDDVVEVVDPPIHVVHATREGDEVGIPKHQCALALAGVPKRIFDNVLMHDCTARVGLHDVDPGVQRVAGRGHDGAREAEHNLLILVAPRQGGGPWTVPQAEQECGPLHGGGGVAPLVAVDRGRGGELQEEAALAGGPVHGVPLGREDDLQQGPREDAVLAQPEGDLDGRGAVARVGGVGDPQLLHETDCAIHLEHGPWDDFAQPLDCHVCVQAAVGDRPFEEAVSDRVGLEACHVAEVEADAHRAGGHPSDEDVVRGHVVRHLAHGLPELDVGVRLDVHVDNADPQRAGPGTVPGGEDPVRIQQACKVAVGVAYDVGVQFDLVPRARGQPQIHERFGGACGMVPRRESGLAVRGAHFVEGVAGQDDRGSTAIISRQGDRCGALPDHQPRGVRDSEAEGLGAVVHFAGPQAWAEPRQLDELAGPHGHLSDRPVELGGYGTLAADVDRVQGPLRVHVSEAREGVRDARDFEGEGGVGRHVRQTELDVHRVALHDCWKVRKPLRPGGHRVQGPVVTLDAEHDAALLAVTAGLRENPAVGAGAGGHGHRGRESEAAGADGQPVGVPLHHSAAEGGQDDARPEVGLLIGEFHWDQLLGSPTHEEDAAVDGGRQGPTAGVEEGVGVGGGGEGAGGRVVEVHRRRGVPTRVRPPHDDQVPAVHCDHGRIAAGPQTGRERRHRGREAPVLSGELF